LEEATGHHHLVEWRPKALLYLYFVLWRHLHLSGEASELPIHHEAFGHLAQGGVLVSNFTDKSCQKLAYFDKLRTFLYFNAVFQQDLVVGVNSFRNLNVRYLLVASMTGLDRQNIL
jgi:hypothetical protein